MNRGAFSFFADNQEYKSSEKDWIVELMQCKFYWYDLIINPEKHHKKIDVKKLIIKDLKNFRKQVCGNIEKRFIYFICSRKKVRFIINKKPKYKFFKIGIL